MTMNKWGVAVLLSAALTPVYGLDLSADLVEQINHYRSHYQRCEQASTGELPPLRVDARLRLPVGVVGDLQGSITRTGYPMVNVQAISLSGPRDASTAMNELSRNFCRVLLDPQFVDVAVSQRDREWKVVLARPLLAGGLGDWQAEGEKLLAAINRARSAARQCGSQSFAPAPALAWNTSLAEVAQSHSRAMANGNFFDQRDGEGRMPGDRAELAGYTGTLVTQNIAAALDSPEKVLLGWLANPTHCSNLMNPALNQLGAAYAVDPNSDAGIYWTTVFGGD